MKNIEIKKVNSNQVTIDFPNGFLSKLPEKLHPEDVTQFLSKKLIEVLNDDPSTDEILITKGQLIDELNDLLENADPTAAWNHSNGTTSTGGHSHN